MRNALLICSTLLIALSGCVLRYPGSYSSGPPSQRRMSRDEAVDYAYGECRSRRLDCRVKNTNLARGGNVWKVRMRAYAPGRKGHIHFEYDAWTRRLIDVDTKIRPWRARHAPRWNVDDDWDDDNDGIADWKDRRNGSRHHSASNPGKSGEKRQKSNAQQKKSDDDDDDDDKKGQKDKNDNNDKSSSKDSRKN